MIEKHAFRDAGLQLVPLPTVPMSRMRIQILVGVPSLDLLMSNELKLARLSKRSQRQTLR